MMAHCRRLAFIVSHPIQYYAPLYRRLAQRGDIEIKVFYTWHAGQWATRDAGFQRPIQWDIPVTDGYVYTCVHNTARDPGTHHFFGLRNPSLVREVLAWRPDAVHLTGYAWASHLSALRALRNSSVPVLFRGDSHLLDEEQSGVRWRLKQLFLQRVYAWPSVFLYVGTANKTYYETFGVPATRLRHSPHSIDTSRFTDPAGIAEQRARAWRRELRIADGTRVLLFAGKFEARKCPLELMRTVHAVGDRRLVLVMTGDGPLAPKVREAAASDPQRFRVLPFHNQSAMPVVYRLGDIFILPSAYGETWGVAVNEAMACGRPVIASTRVGCAMDVIEPGICGAVFPAGDWGALAAVLRESLEPGAALLRKGAAAAARALSYDISRTEMELLKALEELT